jgi:hypothetical protein
MTAITESGVKQDGGDFPRLLERILIADEPQYADL